MDGFIPHAIRSYIHFEVCDGVTAFLLSAGNYATSATAYSARQEPSGQMMTPSKREWSGQFAPVSCVVDTSWGGVCVCA